MATWAGVEFIRNERDLEVFIRDHVQTDDTYRRICKEVIKTISEILKNNIKGKYRPDEFLKVIVVRVYKRTSSGQQIEASNILYGLGPPDGSKKAKPSAATGAQVGSTLVVCSTDESDKKTTGSTAKGTALKRISDVDLVFLLSRREYPYIDHLYYDLATILKYIKDALITFGRYRNVQVKQRAVSFIIDCREPGTGHLHSINVDILPAVNFGDHVDIRSIHAKMRTTSDVIRNLYTLL